MTADDIIAAARSALDTPFRHQGRRVGEGMDCAGLLRHVCDILGVPCIDESGYPRRPYRGMIESSLDSQPSLKRAFDGLLPGDVLLMRFAGEPQHIAIFTGTGIIHALQSIGKVCEHGFTGPWPRRLVRIYRFTGIES